MPSQSSQFHFIDLPPELQREIFHTSALEDMGNATRLVRVSKRAYHWITPVIYDMVTLGSDDTALFMRTLAAKPADFFATHVRCLCLSVSVEPGDAEKILSICTGVRSLAFWVDYLSTFPDSSISHLISPLSLQRLSIEAQHLQAICHGSFGTSGGSSHVWYARLTHLDIVFWEDDDNSHALPYLTQLQSLTQLGLWHPHGLVDEKLVPLVLNACKRLKILLLVVDENDLIENPLTFQDPRVVLMPYPPRIVRDWEASFTGQSSTWSRAKEAFLAHVNTQRISDGDSGAHSFVGGVTS